MPTIATTLGEGFDARITYDVDADGEISDVKVHSALTGQDLTDLLSYTGQLWDQAWSAAERHMLTQPVTRQARRAIAAYVAAMCHDTPYEGVETIAGGVDSEQEQANARLISAAPDMLEACKALIDYCDKHPPMGDSLWSVQLIRKAIKKAGGAA